MKHVTYAEKSLLIDDGTADLLMEYAKILGQTGRSDTVRVNALGPDGNMVDATFLLNSATVMMAETATDKIPGPDNTDAARYLTDRIDELTHPHNAEPGDTGATFSLPDYE